MYNKDEKTFYDPDDPDKITSCFEKYSKYIIENTNECIDDKLDGYFYIKLYIHFQFQIIIFNIIINIPIIFYYIILFQIIIQDYFQQ